jgi:hypothetical protein
MTGPTPMVSTDVMVQGAKKFCLLRNYFKKPLNENNPFLSSSLHLRFSEFTMIRGNEILLQSLSVMTTRSSHSHFQVSVTPGSDLGYSVNSFRLAFNFLSELFLRGIEILIRI